MTQLSQSYQEQLIIALKDPDEAAAYLNAALEEGSVELFLLALQNVAEARNIHSFSAEQNPRLANLTVTLDQLDLRLAITPKEAVAVA
ncbi:MAG: transcriptional regulator [Caldilinea sp. CFX5]|nr:transcriptional regulator [Caldilinea sp. CFX5]